MSENLPKTRLRWGISKSTNGRRFFHVSLARIVLIVMLLFFLGCTVQREWSDQYRIEVNEGLPWWLRILVGVASIGLLLLALRT
jgi:hypothetical protein